MIKVLEAKDHEQGSRSRAILPDQLPRTSPRGRRPPMPACRPARPAHSGRGTERGARPASGPRPPGPTSPPQPITTGHAPTTPQPFSILPPENASALVLAVATAPIRLEGTPRRRGAIVAAAGGDGVWAQRSALGARTPLRPRGVGRASAARAAGSWRGKPWRQRSVDIRTARPTPVRLMAGVR